MNCPFNKQPDETWKCPRCGYQTKSTPKIAPPKICPKPGLGDRVESLLLYFGITKDWYKEKRNYIYDAVGLQKILPNLFSREECDCDSRAEWLNLTGWKWLRL